MKTTSIFHSRKSKTAQPFSDTLMRMKVPKGHAVWLTLFVNAIFHRPFHLFFLHGISLPSKWTWLSEGLVSFQKKKVDFSENPSDSAITRCFSRTRYLSLFDPWEWKNPRGRIWKAQMLCLNYQSGNIINDLLLMALHIQLNLCYIKLQKSFSFHALLKKIQLSKLMQCNNEIVWKYLISVVISVEQWSFFTRNGK